MKLLMVFFFLVNLSTAKARRTTYSYPQGVNEIKQNSILLSALKNLESNRKLKEIKFNIINGDLEYAKILLNEANITQDFSRAIQLRYQAIIYFIEGNYKAVLKVLNRSEMREFSNYGKVCFLKVLSEIILDKTNQAKQSWRLCEETTLGNSPSNLLWMKVLVGLKTSKNKNFINKIFYKLSIENVEKDLLRIYLKLALFLGQQDKIIPRFKYFGASPLENEIERELIGLNYYRNGDLVRAYQLLENLETANSEVFKGNLYLAKKDYELAFAQFKLALTRKSNSRNALDRLIPLSWKLGQYEEGLNFIQKSSLNKEDRIENNTVIAVFLTMAGKHKSARDFIQFIKTLTHKGEPIEVAQLRVLNALILENYDEIEDSGANSCAADDGLACNLIISKHSWDSYFQYLAKEELIHPKESSNIVLQLDESSEPFPDLNLVKQKNIEELDDNLIKLTGQN